MAANEVMESRPKPAAKVMLSALQIRSPKKIGLLLDKKLRGKGRKVSTDGESRQGNTEHVTPASLRRTPVVFKSIRCAANYYYGSESVYMTFRKRYSRLERD